MNYVLSEQTAQKLIALLNREQGRVAGGVELDGDSRPPVINRQTIKCTGASAGTVGGFIYYPGKVVIWEDVSQAYIEHGTCWLVHLNGASLVTDSYYTAQQSGMRTITASERAVFVTTDGSIASGDTDTITFVKCLVPAPTP